MQAHKICYFAGTTGNWGGASRVLFTNLRLMERSRFEPFVILPGPGPAEAILNDMGIAHYVYGSLTEPGNLISYAKAIVRAVFLFRRHGIELVHMNRANDWRPAELFAARLCRIPVVYHFHTVNLDKAPATRMATAICAVSRHVAEHSHMLGVPAAVIHNAVDLERFEHADDIRPTLGLDEKHVVVTFVGQVRRIKGVEDFIAMARDVVGVHVRFLIVGQCRDKDTFDDTHTEAELQALISCDSRIRYCGYQTRIEDYYRSSDVVVVPSRWEEPFGLVIIEAGAAGKAVVATRVGGIPEVIVDERTGFLVERGDVQGMADRVQQLVDTPALRGKMGNAARARVRREFGTRPVRKLEAFYASILRDRRFKRI